MKNRILAWLLCVLMLVGMVPVSAFAASAVAMIGTASYDTLAAALDAASKMNGAVTITLLADAELAITTELFPNAGNTVSSITIDGDQYTLTATGSGVYGFETATKIPVTFKNMKLVDTSFYTYENGENAWEFTYLEFKGNMTFNKVAFDDGVMFEGPSAKFVECSFSGHNNDSSTYGDGAMYGAWVSGGAAEFTNCTFTGTRGLKAHEDYGSDVDSLTVSGCTFGPLSEKPGIALGKLNATTSVTLTDNVVTGVQPGDQGVYLIESDTDLTTFNYITENNTISIPGAVAQIGTVQYATLADAIAAVKDGETVKLLKSVSGSGIDAKKGTSFTLDLGGFTYTANDPAVGSVGTANQGIRFLAGADHTNPGNVTIKNGKIAVSADNTGVYAVINSYLNLTLTDVTIDGTNLKSGEPWVININNGTLTLNGNTNIIAPANGFVRVNGSGNYSGDTAAVFNTTGTIGGKVIVTGDTKADLAIQNGNYTGTIVNENTDAGSISISGGSFEVKPDDEFIAEGLNKQFAEIDGKFVLITKHTCAAGTEWLTDAENHWHVCTESSCPKIFDLGAHDYVDGKCSVCEYPEEGYVAPAQKPAFDYVLFALAARYSQKFDVLVSAENATVSGDLVIKYKRSGTVDIDVADGYQLVDVIANGQSLGAVESVTFKKVMGPQTLVVVTEPIPAETPTEETSVNP